MVSTADLPGLAAWLSTVVVPAGWTITYWGCDNDQADTSILV